MANLSSRTKQVVLKLKKAKKDERNARERLKGAKQKLEVTQAALQDVRVQLSTTRQKLTKTQAELVVIEKRLKKRNDELADRLVKNYRHGNTSYLGVLLGASDFSDLLNRHYVVKTVAEADVDLIKGFREDKRLAQEKKAALVFEERTRENLEHEQTVLNRAAGDEKIEREQALKDVAAERASWERKLNELERESRQIEAMLRRMEKTPQGKRRMGLVWHGHFIRPVNGRITDPFGMRVHPITGRYHLHTGVDLACPSGTPIHAAGGGEVILAGWYGAYGNAVIIDHGNGVTTLYGHQSRLGSRVGQVVHQGDVIGYVGSTGYSTGPHCHFEVRVHGHPVNPLNY